MVDQRNLSLSADLAKRIAVALSGEDDAELIHDTIEGETDFFECIDAMLEANALDEANTEAAKAVIERIKARADKAKERVQKRRDLIADAMREVGLKTVQRPLGTLSVKALAAKPIIYNEDQIPGEYMVIKTTRKPDMKAIGDALKSGKAVSGVRLSNGGQALAVRT
jgi:hypothetical protein